MTAATLARPRGGETGLEASDHRGVRHAADVRALVAAYLQDLQADPRDVRRAIAELDDEGLLPYGLRAYRLAFVTLFGERWPLERVYGAASECARQRLWAGWEFHAAITGLERRLGDAVDDRSACREHVHLAEWPVELLETLLARGRGLVVCGFHFGAYRFISVDLALLGFPVTLAADSGSVEKARRQHALMAERVRRRLSVVNVEEPAGAVALAQALRRGHVLYLNVDGNRGADGVWGKQARTDVRFCGLPLSVKTGVARLGAAFGAPLLTLSAPRCESAVGRVVAGEPIESPRAEDRHVDEGAFVRNTMQSLYGTLEGHVLAQPQEWQDARFLHRWFVPERAAPPPRPSPEQTAAVSLHLERGGRYQLDKRRLVELGGESSPAGTWVDARTLRGYSAPAWAGTLFDTLGRDGGLDARSAARHSSAGQEALAHLLATMLSQGLLVASPPN